jgi:osmotically-inducible protein OsmY
MKTDSQIQADVIRELNWDPSVAHEHIGVAVTDGVVTLSGTIPSYIEKSAAEKAAQRVAGVKAVVEKIEVRLPGAAKRGDEDLAKAIVNQFKWNVQVPEESVKASVEEGWVELTGQVEWDFQRTAAEKCIKGLTGIKGVANNVRIKSKNIQPETIKHKIEEALKREAEREARRISINVRGSTVTLAGNVRSFAEMEDARLAAWSAPGVTKVENNLHVLSYQ